MGSHGCKTMGADIVFAWPEAEMAIMGAEGAAGILCRTEVEAVADKRAVKKEKIDEYRRTLNPPYHYARKMVVDLIIKPQETRNIFSGPEALERQA
jgi:acetyl-CoA carboxylase carboxyltransferase component